MPGAYDILPSRRLVVSRGWGDLTERDFIGHLRRLVRDPRFDPTYRQISDLREVSTMAVSSDDIRRLAEENPFGREARRAFVATKAVVFGLVRMYELLNVDLPDQVAVFRDLDAALAWLGLTDDAALIRQALAAAPALPPVDAPST